MFDVCFFLTLTCVIYLAWRWYGEEYLQCIITDDIRVEEIAR